MSSNRIVIVAVALLLVVGAAWFAGQSNRASSDAPPALHREEPAPAPDAARAGSATVLEVDSQSSSALYRVREQFVNVEFPVDAVGTTHEISGVVVVAADGSVLADQSVIAVNLGALQSDQARRDNFIKSNTLRTQEYPEAHFVPTEIRGLPAPLPDEGEAAVTIAGLLTIHDVTRPVEWRGTAHLSPDGMRVTASAEITFDQFEISKPRVALVLSVADEIRLETDIYFRRSS